MSFILIHKTIKRPLENEDGSVFVTESYSEALGKQTTYDMSVNYIIVNTNFCISNLINDSLINASKLQNKILSEK